MCRIGRGIVVLQMATHAGSGCALVAGGMTFDTIHSHVSAFQRECRSGIVVEVSRFPRFYGMASHTIGGKFSRNMIRIFSSVVILLVTSVAIGRNFFVRCSVALFALHSGMTIRQREEAVINIGGGPAFGRGTVALHTVFGIPFAQVSGSCVILVAVAAVAILAHHFEPKR